MEETLQRKKEKRLLPRDYQCKLKYDHLDNTPKEIEQSRGRFFEFPEDLKGEQFQDREFLVFYFDSEEDYKAVLNYFEIPVKTAISHPELDTNKLIQLVKSSKTPTSEQGFKSKKNGGVRK